MPSAFTVFRNFFFQPHVLAPVSAALGAGAAVCLLGIPSLWTAEAAGWASAVGTTAAAIVALYVGIAPERARRKASAKRALAVTQWADGSLGRQLVHLKYAIENMRGGVLDSEGRAKVIEDLAVLDATSVRALVDYFDSLGPEVVGPAGRCVIDIEAAIQTMCNMRSLPTDTALDMDGVREIFIDAYMSIDDARIAFATQVYGTVESFPPPIEVVVARAKLKAAQ
ncbi:hypothetical protein [Stenotrophomonas indicatrix]|jgi:hypothetical protein|uniref:hypothetical protein n=1 Tax=Stenotrophomonas indicatrix TaxID=2045451 RepID=UPI00242BA519|nr:hypothetical protein [Stenotrophomonas indicatrix]